MGKVSLSHEEMLNFMIRTLAAPHLEVERKMEFLRVLSATIYEKGIEDGKAEAERRGADEVRDLE